MAVPDSLEHAYLHFTGDHKIPFLCEPKSQEQNHIGHFKPTDLFMYLDDHSL